MPRLAPVTTARFSAEVEGHVAHPIGACPCTFGQTQASLYVVDIQLLALRLTGPMT